jgi:hypothetical protein
VRDDIPPAAGPAQPGLELLTDDQKRSLWEGTWEEFQAGYDRFRDANEPHWRAFWTDHHQSALDAALRFALPAYRQIFEIHLREQIAREIEKAIDRARDTKPGTHQGHTMEAVFCAGLAALRDAAAIARRADEGDERT